MKKALRKILILIGIVWYIALMIAGFLAYFIKSGSPNGFSDGLGRSLSESPILMRIFFGADFLWAGFGWFLGDFAIFFGSIAAGFIIGNWIFDDG